MGMTETEMINRWLGNKPFVLIELDAQRGENYEQDDNDYVITMDMTFGGGIGRSGAFGVLAEMLEQNGWTTTAPDGFNPDAED
jgi:hypothetical protein